MFASAEKATVPPIAVALAAAGTLAGIMLLYYVWSTIETWYQASEITLAEAYGVVLICALTILWAILGPIAYIYSQGLYGVAALLMGHYVSWMCILWADVAFMVLLVAFLVMWMNVANWLLNF